jgi:hypothetical protein
MTVLAIAALLNPGKAKHDETIRQQVKQQSPIASLLGAGRLASWVADYHSIGIASYTTIDGDIVTIGAFGMVVQAPARP